jgi:hypothetical protein
MCVAVLGLVAPVLAEPTMDTYKATGSAAQPYAQNWDAGTQQWVDPVGSRAKFWQYLDSVTSGYYTNQAQAAPLVGDNITEQFVGAYPSLPFGVYPSEITELMFGFYAPAAYNPGVTSWTATILLIDNPAGPTGFGFGSTVMSTLVTGLPIGAWFITLDFQDAPVPKLSPNFWFLVGYSALTDAGPLLTFNPGMPGVAYSHDHFYKNGGLYWFGGLPYWADFVYSVRGIPEPMTIGLLAAGGLLVLRRRR